MEAVAVDKGHLHGLWATSEFVEFAGRANRASEASKAASQHEDSFHAHEALSPKSLTLKDHRGGFTLTPL